MANTTTCIATFFFRPDVRQNDGTLRLATNNDPEYELGNIQNISTTVNPEAVEIMRSHGDSSRVTGMPQVSQSVSYEITISELGVLPMLIITGAGGHNINNSDIVTQNGPSSDDPATTQGERVFTLNFTNETYQPQRWYKLPDFMIDEITGTGNFDNFRVTSSNNARGNNGTLREFRQFWLNRSLGLIRFELRESDGSFDETVTETITVKYRRNAIGDNSPHRMAQWMVSKFRTTYGQGNLYVYDDQRNVIWGHTQFRCTVWCSGDITFNPTEIATATITVAVETDAQGRTGYQFGDTSRLPF